MKKIKKIEIAEKFNMNTQQLRRLRIKHNDFVEYAEVALHLKDNFPDVFDKMYKLSKNLPHESNL